MSRSPAATLAVTCLLLNAATLARAADPVQWRADYNTARAHAQKANAPLVVVVGSEACLYCRKQDATTFRDPALADLLNAKAVVVKVNGVENPAFVEAMKIQIYPTTVIATPDGKVVSFLQGYVTADQLRDHVNAAAGGATQSAEVAAKPVADPLRGKVAGELLAAARIDLHDGRVADALERSRRLARDYSDIAEGKAAAEVVAAVEADPVRLAVAAEQLQLRAAELQMTLAEGWLKQGEREKAAACFERVELLAPQSKAAGAAAARLAGLTNRGVPATTAVYRKAP
jgi:thioredoxin-related protein